MARKGFFPAPRIGGGAWRGRKLLPPEGTATRPITGLAKKSLFGMLAGRLEQAVVLDLYCGTGTLGLEALSRGARRCAFAECSHSALARLKRNITSCGAEDKSLIWPGDLEKKLTARLGELREKADLAFVDPPFSSVRRWNWGQMVERLFAPLAAALAEDGLVVLRLPGDAPPPESLGLLALQRTRRYGDMTISFYEAGSQ
ncbi:MAG: 16S rRNA (guanine(966)-N(2))-methyltransferase RsmD [Phycisphaerae bacterium]|nr:16S rRNA (guanine(966)-N(2))-methyltransferase RsmD [Phycisphaerae bacterium]